MAEINVERKGPSVWPWIVGLLVVALLIWLLVEMFGNDDEPVVADEPTVGFLVAPTAPAPAALL